MIFARLEYEAFYKSILKADFLRVHHKGFTWKHWIAQD